jgi:NAD(P)-dependent dehydrogenase (short-subunit alcohol dehydrogenase family)
VQSKFLYKMPEVQVTGDLFCRFRTTENHLDILMNNAGVVLLPRTVTEDGFELLLDLLKRSAPSRIVVLSSKSHENGVIKKDDLMSEKSYGRYQSYCNSKFANNLFTLHLDKLLAGTGVTVNAVHPGGVRTDAVRQIPAIVR